MNDVIVKKDGIDFAINSKIELLSVIQILADQNKGQYKDWYVDNKFYIDKINEFFANYKDHPAVSNYTKYYIYNAQIMKYNFDYPAIKQEELTDNEKEYFSLLNDFVDKSNFLEFYNDMKNYYNDVLLFNTNKVENLKISSDLNDYYKKDIKIEVVLKTIQADWGEFIEKDDNKISILCGVSELDKYPLCIDYKQLSSLCFHECTHPFVNENLTSDYDLLADTESLFINVDENSIARQNYCMYNDYLEDLVVRAVTAYLHFKYGYSTEEEYNKELDYMTQMGFVYIRDVAKILEENDFYTSMNNIKKYLYDRTLQKSKS